MFEPPSPAMSLYFFMRRLRRRWSPLASRRGGDWARPTHLSSLASRRGVDSARTTHLSSLASRRGVDSARTTHLSSLASRRRGARLAPPRDAHGDQRARAEPEQRRATHREDRELEVEGGEPVHDAVPEVCPRGLPESRLARGHEPDGRKRPPHVLLTSARSSRVTTVSPR